MWFVIPNYRPARVWAMRTCWGQSVRLYVLCISILVDHNGLYQHFIQFTAKFLVEPPCGFM